MAAAKKRKNIGGAIELIRDGGSMGSKQAYLCRPQGLKKECAVPECLMSGGEVSRSSAVK